ncbi:MAG: hypothetical protein Q3999_00370 [Buchananella hordeovulneris]|nr:hypothetical protein [Buchananella hordeovulneris]
MSYPQNPQSAQPGQSSEPAYGVYAAPTAPHPTTPPTYGAFQSSPQPAGPIPTRTAPVIMLVLSIIAMILGPIIAIGAVAGTAFNLLEDMAIVSSGHEVHLTAGEKMISASASAGVEMDQSNLLRDCVLVSADGTSVSASHSSGLGNMPVYAIPSDGLYTVSCPATEVTIFKAFDVSTAKGLLAPIMLGFGLGFVGFVCLIISIVWLVKRNKAIRLATQRY